MYSPCTNHKHGNVMVSSSNIIVPLQAMLGSSFDQKNTMNKRISVPVDEDKILISY